MRSPASAQNWAFVVWKYSVRRWLAPASGLAIWIFSLTWEIFRPGSTPTPTSSFATHWGSCSTSRSILSLQPTSVTPISGSAWSRRRPCFMRLEARKYLFDIQQAADSIAAFCAGKNFEQYRADEILRAAVERKFGIVGEALARGRTCAVDRGAAPPRRLRRHPSSMRRGESERELDCPISWV